MTTFLNILVLLIMIWGICAVIFLILDLTILVNPLLKSYYSLVYGLKVPKYLEKFKEQLDDYPYPVYFKSSGNQLFNSWHLYKHIRELISYESSLEISLSTRDFYLIINLLDDHNKKLRK